MHSVLLFRSDLMTSFQGFLGLHLGLSREHHEPCTLKPNCHHSVLKHECITWFTVHHMGTMRAPFKPQCLGLPHELAHCVIPGWGQVLNVALLSSLHGSQAVLLICTVVRKLHVRD